jgi:hypothetical protein
MSSKSSSSLEMNLIEMRTIRAHGKGVAMDSLKFYLGQPCPTLLRPAGGLPPYGKASSLRPSSTPLDTPRCTQLFSLYPLFVSICISSEANNFFLFLRICFDQERKFLARRLRRPTSYVSSFSDRLYYPLPLPTFPMSPQYILRYDLLLLPSARSRSSHLKILHHHLSTL